MIKNLLLLLIVVLAFVIFAEIGVYFYFQNKLPTAISTSLSKSSNNEAQTPTDQVQNTEMPDTWPFLKDNQALDKQALIYIANIEKGRLSSAVLENKYTGKVWKVERDGVAENGFTYQVLLGIQNEQRGFEIMYSAEDFNKINIVEVQNNTENKITIDDIQIDDSIEITEQLNLMTNCLLNNCILEIKIIKL